jgi:peptidylprolyl isomerase
MRSGPLRLVCAAVAVVLITPSLLLAQKAPPAPAADYRVVNPDDLLVVDTTKGRILVELSPLAAPNSVARIRTLAREHFYDGVSFFRVIDEFMDQTGDPTNTGEGGSKLPNLKGEFSFRRGADAPFVAAGKVDDQTVGFLGALPIGTQADDLMLMTSDSKVTAWPLFCKGVMGMARSGDPDSANSQFFFMRGPYPSLEHKYTGFGRVIDGADVVVAIKVGEPVADPQDKMTKVRLASDLPEAERPKVQIIDTRSQTFRNMIDAARAKSGADFSVCDIPIPVIVR